MALLPFKFKESNEESPGVMPCTTAQYMRSVSPLLDPCAEQLWCLQNCPGTRTTLNPGWGCLRQGWMESVMPWAGGGSPRPGRNGNKNWPNLLRVRGSSFTTGSQPGRVRKAEVFFTGFLETFSGEILACSLIL